MPNKSSKLNLNSLMSSKVVYQIETKTVCSRLKIGSKDYKVMPLGSSNCSGKNVKDDAK